MYSIVAKHCQTMELPQFLLSVRPYRNIEILFIWSYHISRKHGECTTTTAAEKGSCLLTPETVNNILDTR